MQFRPPKKSSVPYDPALVLIDERLCQLLAARNKTAGDRPGIPDQDLIEKWAEQYDLAPEWLQLFFLRLENRQPAIPFVMPENLRSVVPLMKTAEHGDITYTITHMMQYANASVVHLEIEMKHPYQHLSHIEPQLNLSVVGQETYQVRMSQSSSNGGKSSMQFTVTPPLPDNLEWIGFGLVPCKRERPVVKELTLDNPVVFGE